MKSSESISREEEKGIRYSKLLIEEEEGVGATSRNLYPGIFRRLLIDVQKLKPEGPIAGVVGANSYYFD